MVIFDLVSRVVLSSPNTGSADVLGCAALAGGPLFSEVNTSQQLRRNQCLAACLMSTTVLRYYGTAR